MFSPARMIAIATLLLPLAASNLLADPCGMVPPVYIGDDVPIVRVGEQKTYVFFKEGVETVVQGQVDDARRNGSIVMFNQSLEEVARWNFENAWPLKVSGPSMKADSNEFGIEELVLTHEGLYREK